MSQETREAAKFYLENGYSVLPVKMDKKPAIPTWRHLEKTRTKVEDVKNKFNGAPCIGIIGGAISGNLEVLDVDDIGLKDRLFNGIKAMFPELLGRLIFTQTPRGYGIIYRCEGKVSGSLKLAKAKVPVEGLGPHIWNGRKSSTGDGYLGEEIDGEWYITPTALETRGEGAYSLIAPSPGYSVLEGSFENLEPISKSDREGILSFAKSFTKAEIIKKDRTTVQKSQYSITRPGDVYNEGEYVRELLETEGWTYQGDSDDGQIFSRPGKSSGTSGVIYDDTGNFHNFSSSAPKIGDDVSPRDTTGVTYSPFTLLVRLKHGGDYKAATKELIEAGLDTSMTEAEVRNVLEHNPEQKQIDYAIAYSGLDKEVLEGIVTDLGIESKHPINRVKIKYSPLELNSAVRDADAGMVDVVGKWGYVKFAEQLGYISGVNGFIRYTKNILELRMEHSVYFMTKKLVKKEWEDVQVAAPDKVVMSLIDYPDSTAPVIRGFSSHPVMEQSGEIIGLQDGLENGISFRGCDGFSVGKETFSECYNRVVELTCKDVLFEDPEVGEALFVSMLMTGICRLGIKKGAPGYFVTANEPGTGKSTIVDMAAALVYGQEVPSIDWHLDTSERKKELTAAFMEGNECILYDNISQGVEVSDSSIAQALSSGNYKGRILGRSEFVNTPAHNLFLFVGNNINMSIELARRLLTIRLIAPMESPANRVVSESNPVGVVKENRVELVGCILRMLQLGVGMENKIEKNSGMGTFWDKMVRNPLLVEQGVDIMQGFDASAAGSTERSDIEVAIESLRMIYTDKNGDPIPFKAKDVFIGISSEEVRDFVDLELGEGANKTREVAELGFKSDLREAMIGINGLSATNTKSLGRALSTLIDRVVGDYVLRRCQVRRRAAQYSVVKIRK